MSTTLHICTTCRHHKTPPGGEKAGPQLFAAVQDLLEAAPRPGLSVAPVECLANCNGGCSAALTAPGKWSVALGRLSPEDHAEDLLSWAEAYGESADGIVPADRRPQSLKPRVVARIPAR